MPLSSQSYKFTIQNYSAESEPYQIIEGDAKILKPGGYGKVVAVRQRELNSTSRFARKQLRNDNHSDLQKEADIMNRLNIKKPTKHIVMLEAAYTVGDECYLVMSPFANEPNLQNLLRDVVFSESRRTPKNIAILRKAFGCITVGLAALHKAGVRHRDLHPGNILFHNGTALYCDFGASLLLDFSDESTTRTRRPPRLERYAAPEVLRTPGEHNRKTDVFQLGAMLYEIFIVISGDPVELAHLQCNLPDFGWRYGAAPEDTADKWHDMLRQYESFSPPYECDEIVPFWELLNMLRRDKSDRISSLEAAACIYAGQEKLKDEWMCADCKDWITQFGSEEIERFRIHHISRKFEMGAALGVVLFLLVSLSDWMAGNQQRVFFLILCLLPEFIIIYGIIWGNYG